MIHTSSLQSRTYSKGNHIFAVPHPVQIIPIHIGKKSKFSNICSSIICPLFLACFSRVPISKAHYFHLHLHMATPPKGAHIIVRLFRSTGFVNIRSSLEGSSIPLYLILSLIHCIIMLFIVNSIDLLPHVFSSYALNSSQLIFPQLKFPTTTTFLQLSILSFMLCSVSFVIL